MNQQTRIWEEEIVIPTYKVYPPEKSPLFIEKRAYQGSTGKVYPLPVTEKISDEKEDVSYHAVFLENEYLKIMVLPELGGRIQRAYDKTNGYDFVYYNHVIKPALVGLAGPWISGGIEFNWPQHHRPSTFSPVDYKTVTKTDGSVSVYVGETDKMYGTKGMAEITLHPGKAYIEIRGQLYNHTELPQTFLWWANPAVSVNDYTYSVFPPDVNAVMDHGKRAVSTFPVATGEYYKQDYSAGVDISRYKNIKVPTSYMAAESSYDFIGNYDESVNAGLLHVADHHIAPGKKQWTWGNGDFGRTWDKNLTDSDGPYIELMTGVFTDNQPDFTWLKPHEEKNFVQYFMPYKGVGRVCNATKEAAISFERIKDGSSEEKAILKLYVTSKQDLIINVFKSSHISCTQNEPVYQTSLTLSPEKHFETSISIEGRFEDYTVTVTSNSRTIVSYKVYENLPKPLPEPAIAIKSPVELKSNEDLWLAGMHLEQYRHATFDPALYYEEGLRRDPEDIRINNSYGLLLYRKGMIKESIPYFKKATAKQTIKNPNPYNGECYFNLGLALYKSGRYGEAFDAFYKSTWSAETQSVGFYWLACIAAGNKDYEQALSFIDQSLVRNWHDIKARQIKLALLRKLEIDTTPVLNESLSLDTLYTGYAYERYLIDNDKSAFVSFMREDVHNYLELAIDYMNGAFYDDAARILEMYPRKHPMCAYYLAYVYAHIDKDADVSGLICAAENMSPDCVFPNRLEEIDILEFIINMCKSTSTAMAHHYLGNLLYDKKQYAPAAEHWTMSLSEKPEFAMNYRNLAIYYYNKKNDTQKALEYMKKACELDSAYPRFVLEYDQLALRAEIPAATRYEYLSNRLDLVMKRDDLLLRYITLENDLGKFDEALKHLENRIFHPWEGGEGKVILQYKRSLIALARKALNDNDAKTALMLLEKTLNYPDNLGEGKLPNVNDHESYYYMGKAYKMLNDSEKANYCFSFASQGKQVPSPVIYYNDQPSDYIYYQGLAFLELGKPDLAKKSFHQLIAYGEKHIFDNVSYDFFAVSLPEIEVFQDNIRKNNENYCKYLKELGYKGIELCAVR